jgi:hypothetical protein
MVYGDEGFSRSAFCEMERKRARAAKNIGANPDYNKGTCQRGEVGGKEYARAKAWTSSESGTAKARRRESGGFGEL